MSLALIAGRGELPLLVAQAQEVMPTVCAYEGAFPEGLVPDLTFRLETLGSLLVALGERGVTQVCLAGGIERPSLDPARLDPETAPLVPLFQEALAKGDDGALRVVVDLFEQTGFEVIAAHQLAPHLLAEGGVYGEDWPTGQMRKDGRVGAQHIAELGPQDIGQACLVAAGKVIAMEGPEGTDALISQSAALVKGKDAILFKGPKPQQTRLVDLPTIGPGTIEAAGRVGLKGVIIDAGDVLVLNKDRCSALADHFQMVLWARTGLDN